VGWKFTTSFSLIKLFWKNGCGGMLWREALWRLVIEAKYESLKGGWCSKEVFETFEVGVWKHFFFISKNSLKSAEGRNPSTQEDYK